MVSEAQVLVIKMYIIFNLLLQPSVEILAKLSFCEQGCNVTHFKKSNEETEPSDRSLSIP